VTGRPIDREDFARALADWRRAATRVAKDDIYRERLAQPIADQFRAFGRTAEGNYPNHLPTKNLISVAGFSWQPVVLMAAHLQPERMLVIGTKESLDPETVGWSIKELIARIAGIPADSVFARPVGDPLELGVYEAVKIFLEEAPPGRTVVDPTGGKKTMSAAAAVAGYLYDADLVYVDYGDYTGNVPVPGTEFPRAMANPLTVFGDLELRRIRRAFNRGAFVDAASTAMRLAREHQIEEASLLALLATAYGAWDAFNVADALDTLDELVDHPMIKETFDDEMCARIEEHRKALSKLKGGSDDSWHIAALLSAAGRRQIRGRYPESMMLSWASVEFGAQAYLKGHAIRVTSHGTDTLEVAIRDRGLDPADYMKRGGPIYKAESVKLALDHVESAASLDRVRSLWEQRNRSPFAHGRRGRISRDELEQIHQFATTVCQEWFPSVGCRVASLEFPVLSEQ